MISRDVEFDESASWNWDEGKIEKKGVVLSGEPETTPTQQPEEDTHEREISETPGTPPASSLTPPSIEDESSFESSPRRVKSLRDIYETCNFITLEPESFEVAVKQEVWRKAMEEEIKTIKKNET